MALWLTLGITSQVSLPAQLPQINTGGIVGAASWSSPVSPGSIISIFGTNLAASPHSANPPFGLVLGGTSVSISGVSAPLLFVSPNQINAQVPAVFSPGSFNLTDKKVIPASIVVTTGAGSSQPATLSLTLESPSLFSADGSGCGRAAALNTTPAGMVSINSPGNSAAPGDYLTLFGTGFGLAYFQPPDGDAAPGPVPLPEVPSLSIDTNVGVVPSYFGLAPFLPGVDQINFQLPATIRAGCSVPVSISQAFFGSSLTLTVSIQAGRGQCVDPPVQSYGQLLLHKIVFSGPAETPTPPAEVVTASFPSGFGLSVPNSPAIAFAPDWIGPGPVSAGIAGNSGCPVPGSTQLSVGTIQIQSPSGTAVAVNPQPLPTGGVTYSQVLPSGFIAAGTYPIAAGQNTPRSFSSSVRVGSPVKIQTPFPPGTSISQSSPLTLIWAGGDSDSLVRLTLVSGEGLNATRIMTYAHASDGTLTIRPLCSGRFCTFSLPQFPTASVIVDVLQAPERAQTATVPGITGAVQLAWGYSYIFSGLTITN